MGTVWIKQNTYLTPKDPEINHSMWLKVFLRVQGKAGDGGLHLTVPAKMSETTPDDFSSRSPTHRGHPDLSRPSSSALYHALPGATWATAPPLSRTITAVFPRHPRENQVTLSCIPPTPSERQRREAASAHRQGAARAATQNSPLWAPLHPNKSPPFAELRFCYNHAKGWFFLQRKFLEPVHASGFAHARGKQNEIWGHTDVGVHVGFFFKKVKGWMRFTLLQSRAGCHTLGVGSPSKTKGCPL